MNEASKRERKINRRPQLYQAALSVVKRGGDIVTEEDRKLFEYALGASGDIGDQARAIKTELDEAATKLQDRQRGLMKRLKKKD
jgi:hypothetical protein